MPNCHGWFSPRNNWHYPVPLWKIRMCKVCGQSQTYDRYRYHNSTVGEFLSMITWARERDRFKVEDKEAGIAWLKESGLV